MDNTIYVKKKLDTIISIPKIITIHYFEFSKDFHYHGESHDFWEMVYSDKGSVIVTADLEEFELNQGEAIFHKPNEFHNIRCNNKTAPNIFIISFDTKSRAMKFFNNKKLLLTKQQCSSISHLITEGRQAFNLPFFDTELRELIPKKGALIGAQQLTRIYLEALLIDIIRAESKSDKIHKEVFDSEPNFKNHIASLVINKLSLKLYSEITITEICSELHYGKTYLSELFMEVTGYGIKEYYILLKISEAKKLIREQNYNVTEIAEILNFSSVQYFSKRFKLSTGMTPTEYINSIIEKN